MHFKLWLNEQENPCNGLFGPVYHGTQKPLAIIIKGNPNRKQPKTPGNLYPKLKHYLQEKGFQVEFDEGKPHTKPNLNAQLWIGHSRGADRLKYAPKHITTISIGSSLPNSINHPDDQVNIKPDDYDKLPNEIIKAHNSWHSSFKEKLDQKLIKTPPILKNYPAGFF